MKSSTSCFSFNKIIFLDYVQLSDLDVFPLE